MNRAWKILTAACGVLVALIAATGASADAASRQTSIVPRAVLGAVHADVTTIDAKGQARKYSWDKGRVTAKSGASLTIARSDGKSVTLELGQETRIRAKNGTLRVGDLVVAYSRDGAAYLVLAFQTREGPPPPKSPAAPATEGKSNGARLKSLGIPGRFVHVDWALIMPDGKSFTLAYDRGEVSARTDGSITLKRADGKSVTLAVGEKTRIQKDGVKVGERAVAFSRDGTALNVISGEKSRN
jgi:Lumazine binding domain